MSKFKSGDQVRCVDADGIDYIKVGGIYTVELYEGKYTKLLGCHIKYFSYRFEPVVVNVPSGLPPEEVAKALLQGKALEYYHKDNRTDECWHKVRNPKFVAINFIESSVFRYAVETMDYYGTEIPKPSTKPLNTVDKLYWVDMRVSKVKQSHYNREGVLYWDTPEQAQEALTAILKPFGITPQPLDERLVQEQPR